MKNVFKFAAVAAIVSLALVACNNNKNVEAEDTTEDTTLIEMCCDSMMDSVIDTVVPEEPAAPAKKTVKKATPKKVEESKPAEAGLNVGSVTKEKKEPITKIENSENAEAKKVTNVERKRR